MTRMMPQKCWAPGLCVFGAPGGGFFFPRELLQIHVFPMEPCSY
jgi:hypothetical protein